MLEAHIHKKMPGFTLSVSLRCEPGKILVLTGPSGAGKTTCARILAGLEKADQGYIRHNGHTWLQTGRGICLPPQQRKIGYVFQEHSLFPHLSIGANIGFACKDSARVEALMERLQIRHIAGQMPHRVSGGERQRAAFAQALASGPELLLLDEPFSALDPVTRTRLQETLQTLTTTIKIPVIHVTHDPAEAEFLADATCTIDRDFSACPVQPQQGVPACPAPSSWRQRLLHALPSLVS